MTFPKPRTILFLAANPKDNERLRLDEEVRDIAEGLQRSRHRDQFRLEQRFAVRPRDIQRAMLETMPQIVHFSGYSDGAKGLIFENVTGQSQTVSADALAGLFNLFADQVQCVVLSGCYSKVQAGAIVQRIPYVVGMGEGTTQESALAFSVGFYDALGAGRDIEFAHQLGCAAIQLEGRAVSQLPILLRQPPQTSAQSASSASASSAPPQTSSSKNSSSQQPPKQQPKQSAKPPLEVFVSYAREDADLKNELFVSLASLVRSQKITLWHDGDIPVGSDWNAAIEAHLASADIFL
ncbi:MAG: toll/interleukin-1 receptor domain-containing protein, partial [Cyanobacteria bacterium J06632_3]